LVQPVIHGLGTKNVSAAQINEMFSAARLQSSLAFNEKVLVKLEFYEFTQIQKEEIAQFWMWATPAS
jgi:hypothetical protein